MPLNEIKHYTTEKLSIYPYNRGARYAKYDQVQHLVFFAENVIYVNELICNTKKLTILKTREGVLYKRSNGYPFGSRPPLITDFFPMKTPVTQGVSSLCIVVHCSLPYIFATNQLVYDLRYKPISLQSSLLAIWFSIFATSKQVYDLRY